MSGSRLIISILAHVDAGKTTLAERLLYICGRIRKPGRVDHGDAFLDNFALERERGITIFSKQARIAWEGLEITLLDTPGHVDFSAEMERTLQVSDYALLVISGPDGVQGHVQTLWRLLKQYEIPVFLFINKTDRLSGEKAEKDREKRKIMKELQRKLSGGCQEFGPEAEAAGDAFLEEISLCDERLLEEYLEKGRPEEDSMAEAVRKRKLFPCYFGSALHGDGTEELLKGIRRFARCPEYPGEFGARVYKISRDPSGIRLTHLKVTGGVLRVRMPVSNARSAGAGEEVWEEKADRLRIYEGAGYTAAEQAEAGEICAVEGLDKTFAGQGLGAETGSGAPVLVPVLNYGVALPEGSDAVKALGQLRSLEEEEPQLHVIWQGETGRKRNAPRIHVQVMGEVQIEVLKRMISDRFGLNVEFSDGEIVYKETIAGPVEGIGHFEPLRHYAEVHLLLEPGEPGSGLQFFNACSGDVLDGNWQRLVMTHLEERSHAGVLTGSALTDVRITLLTGRAHLKHTEGGDFRQAAYRALRQGLMQAESILLEPVFSFRLEIPSGQTGRAMSDIQRMHGSFEPPSAEGEYTVLTGKAPAATMGGYQREVIAYTGGLGRLSLTLKGYEPCHNTEEVMERIGYLPEEDSENPSASIFCAHGAGFAVPWERVAEYAHVESDWSESQRRAQGREAADSYGQVFSVGEQESGTDRKGFKPAGKGAAPGGKETDSDYITQEEIEEIFRRTYGKSVRDYEPYRYHGRNTGGSGADAAEPPEAASGKQVPDGTGENGEAAGRAGLGRRREPPDGAGREEYLLVDGYNIIFAWEELQELAERNIDSARDRLMDICCNYQGYAGITLILVFDAYKVKGNPGSIRKYHNIYVVYTKEAETADQYIEKTVHKIGRKHRVTVATSDRLEQMIIWGDGAVRLSAGGFREAVESASMQMREQHLERRDQVKNRPFEGFDIKRETGRAPGD